MVIPKDPRESVRSPEVVVAGEVVEGAGGLEALRDVGAPAKERRQGPHQAPHPDKNDHDEGPTEAQAAGRLHGSGDHVVAVDGDHGHGVDGHQPEDASYQSVQLAG